MSTGSPRQLWLLPVLLIAVTATAVGGLLARNLYSEAPPLPPAAVEPSPSSVPASEQPGSPEVKGTADAIVHPLYGQVQPLLQRYFDAINAKDYQSWTATVTSHRRKTTPEETWLRDYRTTRDGNIVIYRVEAGSDGTARVLLRFTSTQAVDDAPPENPAPCLHWNVVHALAVERGEWRIVGGLPTRTPQNKACVA